MKIKAAGLIVDVPAVGNMEDRCAPYLTGIEGVPDIVIDADRLKKDRYPCLSESDNYYLETGAMFYRKLLDFNGMLLHSSCVVYEDRAYLFSGPCGMGKSTHTRLWQDIFGKENAEIINDDKPALRKIGDTWYAFGTPWCGKDGINENKSAKIEAICFLHRGEQRIERTSPLFALSEILKQTSGLYSKKGAELLLPIVNQLINDIPIFDLYSTASPEDAMLAYKTMKNAAKEKKNEKK